MNNVTWFLKYSYGGGKSSSKEKTIMEIPLLLAISFKSCIIIHSNIRSFPHNFPSKSTRRLIKQFKSTWEFPPKDSNLHYQSQLAYSPNFVLLKVALLVIFKLKTNLTLPSRTVLIHQYCVMLLLLKFSYQWFKKSLYQFSCHMCFIIWFIWYD